MLGCIVIRAWYFPPGKDMYQWALPVHMSGIVAVFHFFFFSQIFGSSEHKAALHDQNAGVSEGGWFTAERWQELEAGPPRTTAHLVVPSGIDIPGRCNTAVCAHSADTEISSAELPVHSCLFPPRNELGEPAENPVSQKSKIRCSQRAPGLYLSL